MVPSQSTMHPPLSTEQPFQSTEQSLQSTTHMVLPTDITSVKNDQVSDNQDLITTPSFVEDETDVYTEIEKHSTPPGLLNSKTTLSDFHGSMGFQSFSTIHLSVSSPKISPGHGAATKSVKDSFTISSARNSFIHESRTASILQDISPTSYNQNSEIVSEVDNLYSVTSEIGEIASKESTSPSISMGDNVSKITLLGNNEPLTTDPIKPSEHVNTPQSMTQENKGMLSSISMGHFSPTKPILRGLFSTTDPSLEVTEAMQGGWTNVAPHGISDTIQYSERRTTGGIVSDSSTINSPSIHHSNEGDSLTTGILTTENPTYKSTTDDSLSSHSLQTSLDTGIHTGTGFITFQGNGVKQSATMTSTTESILTITGDRDKLFFTTPTRDKASLHTSTDDSNKGPKSPVQGFTFKDFLRLTTMDPHLEETTKQVPDGAIIGISTQSPYPSQDNMNTKADGKIISEVITQPGQREYNISSELGTSMQPGHNVHNMPTEPGQSTTSQIPGVSDLLRSQVSSETTDSNIGVSSQSMGEFTNEAIVSSEAINSPATSPSTPLHVTLESFASTSGKNAITLKPIVSNVSSVGSQPVGITANSVTTMSNTGSGDMKIELHRITLKPEKSTTAWGRQSGNTERYHNTEVPGNVYDDSYTQYTDDAGFKKQSTIQPGSIFQPSIEPAYINTYTENRNSHEPLFTSPVIDGASSELLPYTSKLDTSHPGAVISATDNVGQTSVPKSYLSESTQEQTSSTLIPFLNTETSSVPLTETFTETLHVNDLGLDTLEFSVDPSTPSVSPFKGLDFTSFNVKELDSLSSAYSGVDFTSPPVNVKGSDSTSPNGFDVTQVVGNQNVDDTSNSDVQTSRNIGSTGALDYQNTPSLSDIIFKKRSVTSETTLLHDQSLSTPASALFNGAFTSAQTMAAGGQSGTSSSSPSSSTTVDNPITNSKPSITTTVYSAITSTSNPDTSQHAVNAGEGTSAQMSNSYLDIQRITTTTIQTPISTNKTSNEKIILGDKHSNVGK